MKRHSLLVLVALAPLGGCKWIEDIRGKGDGPRPTGALPAVQSEQLVTYLNERSARLQSLYFEDVTVSASERGLPMPALSGSLVAARPRNFRMVGTAKVGAKLDLGSNADQFWMYLDAPTQKPQFVAASHSDFEAGRARIPGGIPFEPDWVMQALGMATFPPNNQYTPHVDQKERTYTLRWPATLPNGTAVVREVVFDGDPATGTKPQVKKHVVRDTRGKVIATAEVKQARTVPLQETDPNTGLQMSVQHPTLVVLRWEEQRFEMELKLKNGKVNEQLAPESAREFFTLPTRKYGNPIDLAGGALPFK